MNPDDVKWGWCYECGQAMWPPDSGGDACDRCGKVLTPRKELPRALRKVFDFQVWSNSLSLRGLSGLSPGGAAEELGCHRTMIDKLAKLGVLERSVYDKDGFYVVEISVRSIEKALENKKRTGKWTGSGEEKKGVIWKAFRKSFSA